MTIGGSFLGRDSGGTINVIGDAGLIKIAGDFRAESNSGASINIGGKLAGVRIGRSFIGTLGSGGISSQGDMGLVKIGARVKESTRRVQVALASACPTQELWLRLARRLLFVPG